jgi:hypothetical protein
MAYTLVYSGGNITVNDGTLNISNTSLALPGRNYAGYGRPMDQNIVSMLENFASNTTGPANPIKGQFWFDSSTSDMKFNVSSSGNTASWSSIAVSSPTSHVVFGSVTTGNLTTGGPTLPGSITGNWTLTPGSRITATYADLAERFESDAIYEPGTVVEIGGSKEITSVRDDASNVVFGVVSESAAYLLNAGAGSNDTHPAIAMTGRVPVKVKGKVNKGDRLVSAGNGFARAARHDELSPFNIIGRSLEDKTTEGEGKVLAAVSVKL